VTYTLRARLVLVLGAVVAAGCVALVALAILGSAVLLRREQDRTLRSVAAEQCAGVTSEAREKETDLPGVAQEYFAEGQVTGMRLELLDQHNNVLVASGELDGWPTGEGHFRTRTLACGPTFKMRAVAPDVLSEPSVRRVGVTLLAVLPIAVTIGTMLGGAAIARALRPLDDLEQAAARLTVTSPLALGVGARPLEIARIGAALARERRFTQEASHEIRTPLTVLRARVERLASARSDEDRRDHVAAILRELHSLETLAEALLLLARAEEAPLPRVPVNLCDLARGAAHRQGLVDGSQVRPVDVEAPDEILVRGSEELLDRAIGNVVENARKFSGPSGRIRLRVDAQGRSGVISVADDGPGIPEAIRDQVFERFYRDPANRRTSDGAGLGLAVVKAIVARHGGSVSAGRSGWGGAEFRLELPLLR
jgi:two-component system sensor histidine kinase QseC